MDNKRLAVIEDACSTPLLVDPTVFANVIMHELIPEIRRLRESLKPFAVMTNWTGNAGEDDDCNAYWWGDEDPWLAAKKALGENEGDDK